MCYNVNREHGAENPPTAYNIAAAIYEGKICMDEIMRERNCQRKSSGMGVLLLIIGVILFINIAAFIISRLSRPAAGVASVILVLSVMGIAYIVMTRKVSEYYYMLTENKLVFHRAMGIREIRLMEIPYDSILDIRCQEDFDGRVYYFLCDKKDSGRRMIIYSLDGRTGGVVFGPSRDFTKSLVKRTGRTFKHALTLHEGSP